MRFHNEIMVPYGASGKIATELGCTRETVRFALRGMHDTDKANEIRKIAIEKYNGVEVTGKSYK
ncbi:MAG: hypothetical protein ACRDDZ_06350 [Marinifilaceae bacterium]